MPESLHVEVGRPFAVELEAASGTGYGWVVTSASAELEVVLGAPRATRSGMPGAPAITEVTIVAAEAGDYELLVELRRPWEDRAAEQRRFAVSARLT